MSARDWLLAGGYAALLASIIVVANVITWRRNR